MYKTGPCAIWLSLVERCPFEREELFIALARRSTLRRPARVLEAWLRELEESFPPSVFRARAKSALLGDAGEKSLGGAGVGA